LVYVFQARTINIGHLAVTTPDSSEAAQKTNVVGAAATVVAHGVLVDMQPSLFSKYFCLLHETWVFLSIKVDVGLLYVVCSWDL
jgi:hypothetical protein